MRVTGTHLTIMFVTGALIGMVSLLFGGTDGIVAAGTGLAGTIIGGVFGVISQKGKEQ